MTKPMGNEDLSSKPGERVIDKPELPPGGITNENDVLTEMVAGAGIQFDPPLAEVFVELLLEEQLERQRIAA